MGITYTVPNTLHITYGDTFGYYASVRERMKEMATHFRNLKFLVRHHDNKDLMLSQINKAIQNPDIYMWAHAGHGWNGDVELKNNLKYKPSDFTPIYKLYKVIIYSCYAARKKQGWLKHVATGGVFMGSTERLFPGRSLTRLFVTDWYDLPVYKK